MRRTHQALATLALGLALVGATTAAATAAPPPGTGIEDQNDRLLRHLRAEQAERTLAAVALARSMERNAGATAAVTSPAPIEDQNDRLLHSLQAAQAERTQSAVALARSMERDLARHRALGALADQPAIAVQPAAKADPAAPNPGVDVLATLLVGLVGGLLGGAAVMVGWTATTRRRRPRPAAGT
jgi:hypothetical protein